LLELVNKDASSVSPCKRLKNFKRLGMTELTSLHSRFSQVASNPVLGEATKEICIIHNDRFAAVDEKVRDLMTRELAIVKNAAKEELLQFKHQASEARRELEGLSKKAKEEMSNLGDHAHDVKKGLETLLEQVQILLQLQASSAASTPATVVPQVEPSGYTASVAPHDMVGVKKSDCPSERSDTCESRTGATSLLPFNKYVSTNFKRLGTTEMASLYARFSSASGDACESRQCETPTKLCDVTIATTAGSQSFTALSPFSLGDQTMLFATQELPPVRTPPRGMAPRMFGHPSPLAAPPGQLTPGQKVFKSSSVGQFTLSPTQEMQGRSLSVAVLDTRKEAARQLRQAERLPALAPAVKNVSEFGMVKAKIKDRNTRFQLENEVLRRENERLRNMSSKGNVEIALSNENDRLRQELAKVLQLRMPGGETTSWRSR
jgi:hypothetical protein